jgi:hypothetical protein
MWFLPFRIFYQNVLCITLRYHACYIFAHLILRNFIVIIIFVEVTNCDDLHYAALCHFLPFMSEYSSQHSLLKHPQCVFAQLSEGRSSMLEWWHGMWSLIESSHSVRTSWGTYMDGRTQIENFVSSGRFVTCILEVPVSNPIRRIGYSD